MKCQLEHLGWMKCKWSGFKLYVSDDFDPMPNGYSYASIHIVLGWWVYHLRVWAIERQPDCRQWWHYPIQMPVNAEGQGPVPIAEATGILYEVWDKNLQSHDSFDNLPDAINDAMRRNRNVL